MGLGVTDHDRESTCVGIAPPTASSTGGVVELPRSQVMVSLTADPERTRYYRLLWELG